MNTSPNAYSLRLFRLGLVLLASLWWTSSPQEVLAASASSCFQENEVCQSAQGENCENCPQDCDCECMDGVCSGDEPWLETCSSCPEDCWESCVCGDSQCITPAEYGGAGSFNEPECDPDDPEAECSYCPTDCGECDADTCFPLVCADEYGQCRYCENSNDCPGQGQYCDWFGECVQSIACNETQDCINELGYGWACNQDHVCVPAAVPK